MEYKSPMLAMSTVGEMNLHHRFYARRAAEESARATRSVTPAARDWHDKLARDFAMRAQEFEQSRSSSRLTSEAGNAQKRTRSAGPAQN